MSERRGSLYLFTGILIGLGLGLVYSLFINPVVYTNAAPRALDQKSKEQFMVLVALAYNENEDMNRASSRLALLEVENPASALAALAQQKLARGGSPDQAKALANLSVALGGGSPAVQEKTIQDEASPTPGEGLTETPNPVGEPTPEP